MSDRHEHTISRMPSSGTGQALCDCGASMRVVMFKPTEPWHGCPLCCINYDGPMTGEPGFNKYHHCMPLAEKVAALRKELEG